MSYEIEGQEKKTCLECGNAIEYGRQDKKFCSSKCRNDYHNHKGHDQRAYHARVTGILNRNYKILRSLVEAGETSAELGDLVQWGFNPEFMTYNRKSVGRNECHCFEIKYYMSPSKIFNIDTVSPAPPHSHR